MDILGGFDGLLLLRCGDVETNPGPSLKEIIEAAQHCLNSYDGGIESSDDIDVLWTDPALKTQFLTRLHYKFDHLSQSEKRNFARAVKRQYEINKQDIKNVLSTCRPNNDDNDASSRGKNESSPDETNLSSDEQPSNENKPNNENNGDNDASSRNIIQDDQNRHIEKNGQDKNIIQDKQNIKQDTNGNWTYENEPLNAEYHTIVEKDGSVGTKIQRKLEHALSHKEIELRATSSDIESKSDDNFKNRDDSHEMFLSSPSSKGGDAKNDIQEPLSGESSTSKKKKSR